MNVNCVLVTGDHRALLVDTGSTREEGLELRQAVETQLEGRGLVVVNTHAHYDHCFGNSAFEDVDSFASRGCVNDLLGSGSAQRRLAAESFRANDPGFADRLGSAPISVAHRLVDDSETPDLGGVGAELRVVGRGHTDHDLMVVLPELGAVLAGDLVEEGGLPALGDAYPLSWPLALASILELGTELVVPGHGRPVSPQFVAQQLEQLHRLAEWCRQQLEGGGSPAEYEGPFTSEHLKTALERARIELQAGSARGEGAGPRGGPLP